MDFFLESTIMGSLNFNTIDKNLSCLNYLNTYLRCQLVLNFQALVISKNFVSSLSLVSISLERI